MSFFFFLRNKNGGLYGYITPWAGSQYRDQLNEAKPSTV